VLSSAALELCRPHSDSGDSSDRVSGVRDVKPWEEEVRQRLKAKTRIISKVEEAFNPTIANPIYSCTVYLSWHPAGSQQAFPNPISQPLCTHRPSILLPPHGSI